MVLILIPIMSAIGAVFIVKCLILFVVVPPELDLPLLKSELSVFLDDVVNGSFYERFEVPQANRMIKDIAISGNGEPTSVEGFDQVISLIGETILTAEIKERHQFVLITNGSVDS